jgi:hypothetical protein
MLREHSPGNWWERRIVQMAAIWTVAWTGDLNGLSVRVEAGVREARDRGDLYALTTLRTGVPNLHWLRKGDVAEARSVVLDAMKQWTQAGYHSQHYWSLLALTRIELYEGNGRAAYARISREWPSVKRAMILRVRIMAVEARHLRASAALAVAAEEKGTERARLIRAAESDARALERTDWSLGTALALSVRAGAAALRGDSERAASYLLTGSRACAEASMDLHAAAARWQLGRLLGGEQGRALIGEAEGWMGGHGIADCAAMAQVFVPCVMPSAHPPLPSKTDAASVATTASATTTKR